jgi:hypothetical protein
MTIYYVGLDVHSKQTSFVIEDKGGKVIAQGETTDQTSRAPVTRPSSWVT